MSEHVGVPGGISALEAREEMDTEREIWVSISGV